MVAPLSAALFFNFNCVNICTQKFVDVAKFVCALQAIILHLRSTTINFWLRNLRLCFKFKKLWLWNLRLRFNFEKILQRQIFN